VALAEVMLVAALPERQDFSPAVAVALVGMLYQEIH
jgi:hypothetical protein